METKEYLLVALVFIVLGFALGYTFNAYDKPQTTRGINDIDFIYTEGNRLFFDTDELSCLSMTPFAGTGSMLPVINENTTGIVDLCYNVSDVRVGDIIVFSRNKNSKVQHICHRVIDIREDGYLITKGDNSLFADDPIHPNQFEYIIVGLIY